MELAINILSGLFVLIALLMILVILMQRPKSEGLGAAFGGGVTENIFGAQTTNVLTKITGWLAAIFFLLTFALSILYAKKGNSQSDIGELVRKNATPAATMTSPTASPGPSSAVGPPGTVTNPTPATTGPAPSVKPSDLAVGAVPPATSSVAPATSPVSSVKPSAAPAISPSAKPK
ncbi:MAG: preprotein translocase subunit SecG [Chthoniobacterales bacterium]|nr:MAG: preprotein translocase subunit SecG [Chthoniobacterales bacterium]